MREEHRPPVLRLTADRPGTTEMVTVVDLGITEHAMCPTSPGPVRHRTTCCPGYFTQPPEPLTMPRVPSVDGVAPMTNGSFDSLTSLGFFISAAHPRASLACRTSLASRSFAPPTRSRQAASSH